MTEAQRKRLKPILKRIEMLEEFNQFHGGKPWEGEKLPDFIDSELKAERERVLDEVIETINKKNDGHYWNEDHDGSDLIPEILKALSSLREEV